MGKRFVFPLAPLRRVPGRPRPGSEASGVSAGVRGGVFVGVCRRMFVVSVVCGVFLTLQVKGMFDLDDLWLVGKV